MQSASFVNDWPEPVQYPISRSLIAYKIVLVYSQACKVALASIEDTVARLEADSTLSFRGFSTDKLLSLQQLRAITMLQSLPRISLDRSQRFSRFEGARSENEDDAAHVNRVSRNSQ